MPGAITRRATSPERTNNFHVIQRPENDQLNVWRGPASTDAPCPSLLFRPRKNVQGNFRAARGQRCTGHDEFVKRENSISVSASTGKSSLAQESAAGTAHRTSIIPSIERHNWPAPRTRFIVYTRLAGPRFTCSAVQFPTGIPTHLLSLVPRDPSTPATTESPAQLCE